MFFCVGLFFIYLCVCMFVCFLVRLFVYVSFSCVCFVVVVVRSVLDIYHLFCRAFELYRLLGDGVIRSFLYVVFRCCVCLNKVLFGGAFCLLCCLLVCFFM